jgi:altronate dehydratase
VPEGRKVALRHITLDGHQRRHIATGEASIADVGWALFHFILDAAGGRKKTWAELHKLHNASRYSIRPR